jgi:hypothetical protein
MKAKWKVSWLIFSALLAPLAMGGCEWQCDCSGNEVKDAIKEVGDEVGDVIDKAKKD